MVAFFTRRAVWSAGFLLIAGLSVGPVAAQTAYVGGAWYAGGSGPALFTERDTTWAVEGQFVAERPAEVTRVVELGEAFIVPPFGDGHMHAFEAPASIRYEDSLFVARGVLYAFNAHVPAAEHESVSGYPTLVDVTYAITGLTAPGAHPATAYEARALGLQAWNVNGPRGDEIRASRLREGDAYHLAVTRADLDTVWPAVLASGTPWVKIFLDHSDEWTRADGETVRPEQPRGLAPAVAAEIVRRARADGLRVVAHVMTATDLGKALDAGVDLFAHVPGFSVDDQPPGEAEDGAYAMPDSLLARLASAQTPVAPTLARGPAMIKYIPAEYRPDSATVDTVRAFHRTLLRRLSRAGVPIVMGADLGGLWSWDEVGYALDIGGLTPAEALQAWAVATPRAIFPDRAIGALEPEYEASFLALSCNPVSDWTCTASITHREKQGHKLGG